MILFPEAADVLDKAAIRITEVPVVPDVPMARGGENGYSVRFAIVAAFRDCALYDDWEQNAGNPHGAALCEWVADLKSIPEQDRALMLARWEGLSGQSVDLSRVDRSDIRRDDLDQWARGRNSTEVANVLTGAARVLRTLPSNEGLGRPVDVEEFTEADMPELLDKLAPAVDTFGGMPPGVAGALGEFMEMLRKRFDQE